MWRFVTMNPVYNNSALIHAVDYPPIGVQAVVSIADDFHAYIDRQPSMCHGSYIASYAYAYIDDILPREPSPPCLRMADRALLAGYPRNVLSRLLWSYYVTSKWMIFSPLLLHIHCSTTSIGQPYMHLLLCIKGKTIRSRQHACCYTNWKL